MALSCYLSHMSSSLVLHHVLLLAGSVQKVLSRCPVPSHSEPNARSKREGISAVTDGQIEACVAAQPKDTEQPGTGLEPIGQRILG